MKIIAYTNSANEILVVTLDKEHELIQEYFIEGGRDLDDYDRKEIDGVLEIGASLTIW